MTYRAAARRLVPALLLAVPPVLGAQRGVDSANLGAPLPVDSLVTVGKLENGLRYYIRVNQRPEQRAELRLVVNAGSVLEDDDQQGLAHFVEHMAFNGTAHFARQELVSYLESIGMRFGPDLNAYTGFDETVYLLTVPTDTAAIVAKAFQILEDWARYQTFDAEQIDKERGVIIEEWRLGRGANARMRDKQLPVLFKGSRYAERLPIGRKERLEQFDHAALRRFYTDWYRPDLMAVVAVGDFNLARVEALIRAHFAGIPAAPTPRARPLFPVPGNDSTLFAIATDKEATTSLVSVYYKQPAREHGTVGAYRRELIERLYNGMLNARFFELTEQADPPFIAAFSGQGRFVRSSEVYTLGALVRENGVERGLEALLTEAERVARHGFTASELERQQRELLRTIEQRYAEQHKTNSAVYAAEYVQSYLEGEPISGIAYEYEEARRFVPGIALEEVNRLAREWVTDRNRVVLLSAPEKPGVRVPSDTALLAVQGAVQAKAIAPYAEAVSDAPLVAQLPAPAAILSERVIADIGVREWRLANGVRVLLKPTDFKDDEIVFGATSPGGTSLAADSDFIAANTADILVGSSGVGAYNAVDLQKKLAGRAVYVGPTLNNLSEGLSGRASPKDVETLFQLIYLYFTAPRLDSASYLAFKSRVQGFLENRSADPGSAFQDTAQVTLTQHHFRTRPATAALYDEMNLRRSLAFYRDRFADAGDFTFVFVGSFDPDSIKPLVQSYLGGLPSAGRRETWRDVGIRPPAGVIQKTVRKGLEPKSRTQIAFTGPFTDSREHRYALRSLAEVLERMLRDRLREELGGTYSVAVGQSNSRYPRQEYAFTVSFGAAPKRLDSLVQVVFRQLDSLRRAGPSETDVNKVRETQRRGRETDLKQNSYWLGQMLVRAEYGSEDFSDILTYEKLIDGLSARLIRDAARRYLRMDAYVQVSLYPEQR